MATVEFSANVAVSNMVAAQPKVNSSMLQAQRRGRKASPGTHAIISNERNNKRRPLREISANYGVPKSTISDFAKHSAKNAILNADASYHSHNTGPQPRIGAPYLLTEQEIDAFIILVTSTYVNRRRPWMDIAKEFRNSRVQKHNKGRLSLSYLQTLCKF